MKALKTIDLQDAVSSLPRYAEAGLKERIVVTRRGKPVFSLVPLEQDEEWEDHRVATDPKFAALMRRSEALYPPGTGIPLEEVKRRYGIESRRRARRPARKAR
jgi:antitoxin (DNA-binding transcriptional repressor) of toxin-antitoxin stability system